MPSSRRFFSMASITTTALLLLLLLLLITTTDDRPFALAASSTTYHTNVAFTWATLLSGDMDECTNPGSSIADCEAGVAAADAFIRHYIRSSAAAAEEPVFFSPTLDRNTPFVQMHPLNWGVNRLVYSSILNYSQFRATHAVLTSNRNMSYLRSHDFPFLLTNVLVPPSNLFLPFWETVHYDEDSRVALLAVQAGSEPNSFDSFSSTRAALANIKAANRKLKIDERNAAATTTVANATTTVAQSQNSNNNNNNNNPRQFLPWLPVILFDDQTIDFAQYVSAMTDDAQVAMKPAAIIKYEESMAITAVNGTFIAGFASDSKELIRFRLTFSVPAADNNNDDEQTPSFTMSGMTSTVDNLAPSNGLPSHIADATYISHLTQLRQQVDLAKANDPIVGVTGFMPFTRVRELRMCMRGECELGDLFTDAARWKTDADIAFVPSGGLRGPGWPAGNVRVSDMWAALPFVNTLAVAQLSGVSIYKIVNYSVSLATFTSTGTETGDRLLQISGARITYNTKLLPPSNRLVSVEVLDRATNQYRPLERLKIFKVVTDSFVAQFFDPYPSFFSPSKDQLIAGEVPVKVDGGQLIQQVVADFLTQETLLGTSQQQSQQQSPPQPYDTTITLSNRRMINDTAAPSAMASLVNTRYGCAQDFFWRPSIQTCLPCPVGTWTANKIGELTCIPRPANITIRTVEASFGPKTVAAAVTTPVLLIVFAAVGVYFYRKERLARKNVRDVKNAPKEEGQLVALIFSDIESSTKLWATAPLSMSAALDKHNEIIRKHISLNNNYEVKTAGDAFMVASGDPQAAVRMAVDIQRELRKTAVPRAINDAYAAKNDDELLDVMDDPSVTAEVDTNYDAKPLFGIRIRIGVHVGNPKIVFDQISRGYDYFGPCVNIAARVEGAGVGGGVMVTRATVAHINADAIDSSLTPVGSYELKGVPDQTELLMLMPNEFSARGRYMVAKLDERKRQKALDEARDSNNVGDQQGQGHGSGAFEHNDAASHGGFSEAGTAFGGGDGDDDGFEDVGVHEDVVFLQALFKAVKPKDKEAFVRLLEKSWRVRKRLDLEQSIVAVAKRVSTLKHMLQEREIQREARKAGQSYQTQPLTMQQLGGMGARRTSSHEEALLGGGGGNKQQQQQQQQQQPFNQAAPLPVQSHYSSGGQQQQHQHHINNAAVVEMQPVSPSTHQNETDHQTHQHVSWDVL